MGIVYRAYDTRLERPVALKLVNDASLDGLTRSALLREARYASALNHPHVCTIYEVGDFEGEPYIAMEWVDGQPLDRIVVSGGVGIDTALRYGIQIADALAHAHERGIVHRDLKSANIAITRDERVKLLDFGVARRLARELVELATREPTIDTAMGGTLAYMGPEVLRGGTADERGDIWAAGIVLYELLTGARPFAGNTGFEVSSAIMRDQPAPLPIGVPSAVGSIAARCLMKDPLERYQSARALKEDLEQAARTLTTNRNGARPDSSDRSASTRERVARQQSLAVLYFDNLGGVPDQEYLRDGMTEDVITELCNVGSLRVFPRSAVITYRDKPATATEIGRQLNASYVLTGSVRQSGSQIRVTAQLVESTGGHTVWAERYDRDLHNVFELQDEIARSIARALKIKLSPKEEDAIARGRVVNAEAYDCYLRGRRLLRRGTKRDVQSAAQMFEQAVGIDAHFALAYAGIGHAYGRVHRYSDQDPEWMKKGIQACEQALDLEPHLPEALAARACLFYAHEQYEESVRCARMALDRKEDCEAAYYALGASLNLLDRLTEAAELADRAVESSGDDFNVFLPYLSVLLRLGDHERATRLLQKQTRVLEWHVEWAPDNVRARVLLSANYAHEGRRENAIIELKKAVGLEPDDPSTLLNGACTYAVLGLKQEALSLLERAIKNGYWHVDTIARDPDFASLHDEPEFERLLRDTRRSTP